MPSPSLPVPALHALCTPDNSQVLEAWQKLRELKQEWAAKPVGDLDMLDAVQLAVSSIKDDPALGEPGLLEFASVGSENDGRLCARFQATYGPRSN